MWAKMSKLAMPNRNSKRFLNEIKASKVTLSLILLLCLQKRALAQGLPTFTGGVPLDVNFSAVSNPPGTNQLSGGASFFQVGWNPDTSSPVPDQLIVSINLGMNQATETRLERLRVLREHSPATIHQQVRIFTLKAGSLQMTKCKISWQANGMQKWIMATTSISAI
jgi:hypothetical protein